jgi:hypothetical protein
MKEHERMNQSKASQTRFWRRWYAAGAVKQPVFPPGSLVIDAIGTHLAGPAEGYCTLSLCRVTMGPVSRKPITAILVPTKVGRRLGDILPKIPGNAIPLSLVFGNRPGW